MLIYFLQASAATPLARVGTDLACLNYFKKDVIDDVLMQITARLRLIVDKSGR